MSLAALAQAPAVMLVHAACATLSLMVGTLVIFLPKGTPRHVMLGRIFAGAMLATALTSFAITRVWQGHFSAIHILSMVTLTTIPLAIWLRRQGNIGGHARVMALNYLGLLIAGAFTLVPPRLLGVMLLGGCGLNRPSLNPRNDLHAVVN